MVGDSEKESGTQSGNITWKSSFFPLHEISELLELTISIQKNNSTLIAASRVLNNYTGTVFCTCWPDFLDSTNEFWKSVDWLVTNCVDFVTVMINCNWFGFILNKFPLCLSVLACWLNFSKPLSDENLQLQIL